MNKSKEQKTHATVPLSPSVDIQGRDISLRTSHRVHRGEHEASRYLAKLVVLYRMEHYKLHKSRYTPAMELFKMLEIHFFAANFLSCLPFLIFVSVSKV